MVSPAMLPVRGYSRTTGSSTTFGIWNSLFLSCSLQPSFICVFMAASGQCATAGRRGIAVDTQAKLGWELHDRKGLFQTLKMTLPLPMPRHQCISRLFSATRLTGRSAKN